MSGSTTSFLFQGQPIPPQPTSSDTSSAYPLWLQQFTANLGNAATNLASTPYTPYPGQQVATPSAATQQSWNMAQNNVGNYQPALTSAMNTTGAATGAVNQGLSTIGNASPLLNAGSTPITAGQISNYMNPYMGSVLGGLQSASNQNFTQNQLPAISSQFVGAGQAASPQMAQADSNALYQNNQALYQAESGALQGGYNTALSAAQQDQARMLQAGQDYGTLGSQTGALGSALGSLGSQYGTLGALTQQLGAGDVGQIAASGAAQDTTNQANINASMNNFYAQQQWPYQNLGFASNIVRGLPVSTNTQTVGTQYVPSSYTASPLSAFTGTLLGANSIANGNSSAQGLKHGGRVRATRPPSGYGGGALAMAA